MTRRFISFLRDEDGAVAIEYGLILLIIVLGIVYGATQIGTKTAKPFNTLGNVLG